MTTTPPIIESKVPDTAEGISPDQAKSATSASSASTSSSKTDERRHVGVDTIGIALPTDWVRIPLGDDFENFVRQQRSIFAKELAVSKTSERQIELLFRQLRNDCKRADVTLAAVMWSLIGDDADPPDSSGGSVREDEALLTATCTVSSLSRSTLGSELPLTVNTLAAALTRIPPSDDGIEVVNLEPPAIVEFDVGRVAKVVRLVTLPPAPISRQRLALFNQTFFVPFDDGEKAAVVSFATSTPAYARPLSVLFDNMMTTFRLFSGDDPTDLVATKQDVAKHS